nr:MAG TPA: hypothetical protein [Bacteriophage sp.]
MVIAYLVTVLYIYPCTMSIDNFHNNTRFSLLFFCTLYTLIR